MWPYSEEAELKFTDFASAEKLAGFPLPKLPAGAVWSLQGIEVDAPEYGRGERPDIFFVNVVYVSASSSRNISFTAFPSDGRLAPIDGAGTASEITIQGSPGILQTISLGQGNLSHATVQWQRSGRLVHARTMLAVNERLAGAGWLKLPEFLALLQTME